MRIVVAVKQVPDLVEELELAPGGTDVDREFVRSVVSEFDEHALEEALLLKEGAGGEVTVVGFEEPDVDQTLFTALAKGADRAVKLTGLGGGWLSAPVRAAALAHWLEGQDFDLVLTGVQAVDDLEGQVAPALGSLLGLPHVSVVVGVEVVEGGRAVVTQEFGGGRATRLDVRLPAVLGIQAARQAPRYVSISRIRQAQQEGRIEEAAVRPPEPRVAGPRVRRLFAPEKGGGAEMLEGSAAEVAQRIVDVLRSKGLVKG
jgi:electron transfer flavoprotein beta subunit